MPTYDYRCPTCGKAFDKFVPIAQRDEVACPECGAKPVTRLMTGGGIVRSGGSGPSLGCGSNSGCGSGGFG